MIGDADVQVVRSETGISRRTLTRGAAWSVPAVASVAVAPAAVASPAPEPAPGCYRVAYGTGVCAQYPLGFLSPASFNGTSQQGNSCCNTAPWEQNTNLPLGSQGCISVLPLSGPPPGGSGLGNDYVKGYEIRINCSGCGINDYTTGVVDLENGVPKPDKCAAPGPTGDGGNVRYRARQIWFKSDKDAAYFTFYISCGSAAQTGGCNLLEQTTYKGI